MLRACCCPSANGLKGVLELPSPSQIVSSNASPPSPTSLCAPLQRSALQKYGQVYGLHLPAGSTDGELAVTVARFVALL